MNSATLPFVQRYLSVTLIYDPPAPTSQNLKVDYNHLCQIKPDLMKLDGDTKYEYHYMYYNV